MEHRQHQLDDVAQWAGSPIAPGALPRLTHFAEWLVAEALPAGGIGPGEGEVVWERHVLDAVQFLRGVEGGSVVDVGTGVGLPGIPIAICRPDVHVDLLDRSGRRRALAARALRVLGLENATVVAGDVLRDRLGTYDGLVMRAALPPDKVDDAVRRLGASWAVVGGGLDATAPEGWHSVRFPGTEVLAPGRWLRMMLPT